MATPSKKTSASKSGSSAQNGSSNKGKSKTQKTERSSPKGQDEQGLRKLLVDQMKDMLWAEKKLTTAIPKMIKKASSEELIESLTNHLEETKEQVSRLEQAFQAMNLKATAKECEAMKGLVKEAEELMEEMEEGSLRDAAIICAAQKVEHYEIATYGCLVTYSQILGETEVAELLNETLSEEKGADETLTEVSQNINWMAEEEAEEEDAE
ncbi:MAG TPA: ferritin-like domain-containing protein [Saprospiraceae bacterium]|nr:ferritin-like domain-containing protein [Saprospiraceae bacterium]